MMQISCPHCGAQTHVDEKYVGRAALCGNCDGPVIITSDAVAASFNVPTSDTASSPQPATRPERPELFVTEEHTGSPRRTLVFVLLGLVAIALLFGGLNWIASRPQSKSDDYAKSQCDHRINQIALALQSYHDDYGTFPPAYVTDENGRRMHSWRVLVLPYLGEWSLYQQYDFDEPWDGPNNSRLHDQIPSEFRCGHGSGSRRQTDYMVIVGNNSMFPHDRPRSLRDMRDSPAHTILVVEVSRSETHWMEPRDLEIGRMSLTVNSRRGRDAISSHHEGGATVAMADGSTHFLSDDLPGQTLVRLIDPNDGYAVGELD